MKIQRVGQFIGLLLLLLIGGMVFMLPVPLQAQILEPTATPDADGIIYAQVQVDDSLWAIASRSHISLDELLVLNGMTEGSIIRVGDLLIIGYVTPPATATSEPTITPTLSPPTPTFTPLPLPETAVCLRAYVDANQNGVYDPGEKLRPSVAFTIFNENAVAANYVTTGVSEPHCIKLEPGTYQITRSMSQDEHLTTDGNVAVVLRQGDRMDLAFGGFIGATATPSQTPEPVTPTATPEMTSVLDEVEPPMKTAVPEEDMSVGQENGRSPAWLVGGLVLLTVLMVLGVIFFVVRMRRA
ncbi:MAG: LysM peptidoglycan-binding domain-containing protein [Anaerolineae bacterium]|nr:LysM peptidoglycan-binding domain-containing protein [Anaerolineae bacterium]